MFDIEKYLVSHGVNVSRDDGIELACYCPFHANADTPAFYINKKTGLWICFNPSCDRRGSLKDLMEHFGDSRPVSTDYDLDEIMSAILDIDRDEHFEDWDTTLEEIRVSEEDSYKVEYLINRGFSLQTIIEFEIGFSEKKGRLVIPVRDELWHTIGFIGRAINDQMQPKYLYSKGFPRKDVLFNLNRAKEFESVIIVEGSLDAIKIHQAGHKNVVASLGAAVTKEHAELLKRYFNSVIIFSDNDHAGLAMRNHVIELCPQMNIFVVEYDDDDVKDPGMMSDSQITEHIGKARDYLAMCFDL